ncbi:MAG: c-type cytochrome [Gemmatimonadetes bacterium]|nr:c-type cytochrome [Gemmatimonadota bacterium]
MVVRIMRLWLSVTCVLVLAGCAGDTEALRPGLIEHAVAPAELISASEGLLRLGAVTYGQHCAACHGVDGDGAGEAAYLLYPRPRDFTTGSHRVVSTWDGVPTDEDLFRTISRGMPGSAMPSWAHLPERTRWALVHYVKTFSKRPLEVREPSEPASFGASGAGVIQVPPEPPYTPEAEARARELYAQGCAPCHGPTGRGDGPREQFDSKGFPTRPRDFGAGVFRGSSDPEGVYRRIVAGMPGSPMPQSGYLHGNDAWHLTHFVRSMSSPERRARAEMRQFRIVASRVPDLPRHPDSGIWRNVPAVTLHLMPLWWRDDRPESVTVQAVHDGREIAVLMQWPDATPNATAIRPQDFRDAAAIEVSASQNPPFFAMGQSGEPVRIWMWKAERQADLQPAFQDLETVYPNIGIDSYPNLLRSPIEQPVRNALTLELDPTFVTGWGAGNIVSDPTRRTAAEDLVAEGFGTLQARPLADQPVAAQGVYGTGSYRVLFRRELDRRGREFPRGRGAARDSVTFIPESPVAIAFAVWDGSAGDRDGKKSVTIWQELVLTP